MSLHLDPLPTAERNPYLEGAFAPTQYSVRGSCGVIVVWTKQSRRPPAPPSGGQRSSGAANSP